LTPIPNQLLRILISRGFVAEGAISHRLVGGRTNQVWRVARARGDVICKLFAPPAENPLYPNNPAAEFAVLKRLSGLNLAPEPVALIATTLGDVLIYRCVEGGPWRQDSRRVAQMLGRIHRMTPDMPLRQIPSGTAALRAQIARILAGCREPEALLAIEPNVADVPALPDPRLVHTDTVPGNIIVTAKGLQLIDWQCPGLGDPAEDISAFLSPAMQLLYRGKPLDHGQRQSFLAAYPDPEIVRRYLALAPLYHLRIAAYCQWKTEAGDAAYGPALVAELSELKKPRANHHQAGDDDAERQISRLPE